MSHEVGWTEAVTLEEFFRDALKYGRDQEAIALMNALPEKTRERYRLLWTEIKSVQKPMDNTNGARGGAQK